MGVNSMRLTIAKTSTSEKLDISKLDLPQLNRLVKQGCK